MEKKLGVGIGVLTSGRPKSGNLHMKTSKKMASLFRQRRLLNILSISFQQIRQYASPFYKTTVQIQGRVVRVLRKEI